MLPFGGRFYGFESWLDHPHQHHSSPSDGFFVPEAPFKATDLLFDGAGRSSKLDNNRKSTEACKSHREAERRRRQRINAHLSTLRSLLPNTAKADKASLLAEVVKHVKRLKKEADDVARDPSKPDAEAETWPFPGEADEATLSYCDGEPNLVKATLCCEDRPGLNRDLTHAIRSVRAKAVRAEMMTVGGRTKSVVVIQWPAASGGGDSKEGVEVGALERALKAVIENRALVGSGMGRFVLGQKRAWNSYDSPDEFLLTRDASK
ncbi:transcription factor bHLH30-like [Arachis duranensis]|uniref:Transcription factor bHLH30-like n=1 Tax=Arachis duranensis TaxID=130453 RepID=A0A6P4BXU3_ARADU|nr:transcription factor bHLH30-like [Arachis duranensis]